MLPVCSVTYLPGLYPREVLREVMPLEHGIGLLPGHCRLSEGDSESVSHVPGQVLTMSLYCTGPQSNLALL